MKEPSMLEQIWGIPDDETPMCDCGNTATYLYGPGHESGENPFYCDECVPRSCDCNHNFTKKHIEELGRGDYSFDVSDDYSEEPPQDGAFQWIKEGHIWQHLDEMGRPYPCCEYVYLQSAKNAIQIK
jgi:hypothetical protein